MGTLLLFVDGVGIGADDPVANPFAAGAVVHLGPLAGRAAPAGCAARALDATLGVPGLPQSATGQTTLFTGVNAARVLGRHHVGIPGPTLWPLLERESLFRKIVARGGRPAFANAFPRRHLESRRPRWGATTRMVRGSGLPLRSLEADEPVGAALTHDYTGTWARSRGATATERTAREAAAVLDALLREHDLVLYEYFLTDLAGHRGSREERWEQARRVDALVGACLDAVDLARNRLAVVSDHGNLEEADHDRHTLNPAPLLAWGRDARALVDAVRRFEDLTPALVAG